MVLTSGCDSWRADPNRSTEVELSSDLSAAQVVAVHNAVLEINAAVGRELFHVRGDHVGFRDHITVTTDAPKHDDMTAETVLRPGAARIRLGTEDRTRVVVHELLHTILGGASAHSHDPADYFYPKVSKHAVFTDATLARIETMMDPIE